MHHEKKNLKGSLAKQNKQDKDNNVNHKDLNQENAPMEPLNKRKWKCGQRGT